MFARYTFFRKCCKCLFWHFHYTTHGIEVSFFYAKSRTCSFIVYCMFFIFFPFLFCMFCTYFMCVFCAIITFTICISAKKRLEHYRSNLSLYVSLFSLRLLIKNNILFLLFHYYILLCLYIHRHAIRNAIVVSVIPAAMLTAKRIV